MWHFYVFCHHQTIFTSMLRGFGYTISSMLAEVAFSHFAWYVLGTASGNRMTCTPLWRLPKNRKHNITEFTFSYFTKYDLLYFSLWLTLGCIVCCSLLYHRTTITNSQKTSCTIKFTYRIITTTISFCCL